MLKLGDKNRAHQFAELGEGRERLVFNSKTTSGAARTSAPGLHVPFNPVCPHCRLLH